MPSTSSTQPGEGEQRLGDRRVPGQCRGRDSRIRSPAGARRRELRAGRRADQHRERLRRDARSAHDPLVRSREDRRGARACLGERASQPTRSDRRSTRCSQNERPDAAHRRRHPRGGGRRDRRLPDLRPLLAHADRVRNGRLRDRAELRLRGAGRDPGRAARPRGLRLPARHGFLVFGSRPSCWSSGRRSGRGVQRVPGLRPGRRHRRDLPVVHRQRHRHGATRLRLRRPGACGPGPRSIR